ncbi:MAG: acetyl-CoA carboxylase biotin carboxyl carrier protein subunit [Actinomycetes bacterium]
MDVIAPMLANVWKVCVRDGDTVQSGEVLVILECMKMEIPVEAPIDGVIKILVEEGEMVEEGTVLASVGQ